MNSTIIETGQTNLLSQDGIVHYYGRIFDPTRSSNYFEKLLTEIEWKNDEAVIFGKHYKTKRKAAWYGSENYSYTYSNRTKEALCWTNLLLELKQVVETVSGEEYNSCLLNLYHNGEEGMAWHSDDEKEMKNGAAIASVSFGAERNFYFRHKISGQKISILLENGSLLVMKGSTQASWLHSLPKSKRIVHPRINLTFRTISPNT